MLDIPTFNIPKMLLQFHDLHAVNTHIVKISNEFQTLQT